MGAPQTLPANFDQWDKAPATLPADFNQWDKPKPASAASRLGSNFLSGFGVTDDEGAKNFFAHPLDTVIKSFERQGELAKKARDSYEKGDYEGALQHALNYMVPFIGQQTDQAGEQLKEGDYAGGIGRTLGAGAAIVAGSPETQEAAVSAAAKAGTSVADTAPSVIRAATRKVNAALAKAPGTVGATVGGAVGAATHIPYATEAGAGLGAVIGKEVLPQVKIPGEGFGLPNRVTGGPASVTPFEPSAPEPPEAGAPLPEVPDPALVQGSALSVGGKPAVDPSSGLGRIPVDQQIPGVNVRPSLERVAPQSVYPGAPLPEAPSAELAQAKGLSEGGKAPAKPQAAALADLPIPAVQQAIHELGPQATIADLTDRANEIASGTTIPRTLSGDSALTQILTGQDNANLLKIAKSRGINVTKESQLKPGVADKMLIDKIAADMTPDELDEIGAKYLENQRMGGHKFGDVGSEAWKAMSLQTYFPDVKIPAAVLKRTQAAIGNAAPKMPSAAAPPEDLSALLQKSLEEAKRKRAAATQ